MKNQRNRSRHLIALIVALIGLVSGVMFMPGPARLASAQAIAPGWSFTGSLNTARSGHTATLLPSGTVLVAGGYGDSSGGVLNSAELYDPATGKWSVTGRLNKPRVLHTATLLQDGKVLVVGGNANSAPPSFGITDSAELYDPATGTWSLTGKLNTTRAWHTATLLRNGKVLVAGGYDGSSILNTAELYDPATATWSVTGSLLATRYGQTATLLQDGKVLVAAGSDDGDLASTLASAELYDPATGTWRSTDSLSRSRISHTATLLPSGKVLIAGGYNWPPTSFNSAELYDPAIGNWSYTASLNEVRDSHTATLLPNGKVLVTGGQDWNRRLFGSTSAELYDPATGTWGSTADLNTARVSHTATLLPNRKVLVSGGYNNASGTLSSAELYEAGTDSISNPIDDAQAFVRQHYRDFLNREPDADGFAFWTNEIASCDTDQQCIEVKRINDSAAFFLSIEFQQTGYLVYRIYKASYGDVPGTPVPVRLGEFLPDTQQIGQGVVVNRTGWEQVLENNKQAFTLEFVQRSRFTSAYPTSLTPTEFVDKLYMNAEVTPSASDRADAINEFGSATTTSDPAARARALRRAAENSALTQQEFNRAFVLMQYFGYLQRNPNDPPEPTLDFQGYNFWLNKLNQFNGNFIAAEMVKAFITSGEYRQRFGQS